MESVAQLVQSTTTQISPASGKIPTPLWAIFEVFQKCHRLWRWYRRAELYSNPDNFLKLAAGHTVQFAVGEQLLLRIAAQTILIATRILQCVEEHQGLLNQWERVQYTFEGTYRAPFPNEHYLDGMPFLSSSTIYWWETEGRSQLDRIRRLAEESLQLCWQAFRLSMTIMDAIEAFSLSPESQREGVNELFINGTKWIDQLVKNKEVLLNSLEENQELIQKVLHGIGSPMTSKFLIDKVKVTIEKTEDLHNVVNGTSHVAGQVAVAFGKKTLWGVMQVVGIEEMLPKSMHPPARLPLPEPERANSRFPLRKRVTKGYYRRKPKKIPMPRLVQEYSNFVGILVK